MRKKVLENSLLGASVGFCLWRSPDLVMVSVVVVVVVVVLLVGATFVLSDLCTIQKNL